MVLTCPDLRSESGSDRGISTSLTFPPLELLSEA